jgi:3-oxoacyl-[acyl-carrier protein] reductase
VNGAFDLSGRVALVTGAGSPTGIGFATAILLADMGASVLVSSTTDRINERVGELRAHGADASGVACDLTEVSGAPSLVSYALERWGRLDVVVQNAGMYSVSDPLVANGPIEEMDLTTWRAGLSRNLDTTFLVAKACLPAMAANKWGRLVFVSSVTGPVMAMTGEPAYAAAKAGMVGLAKSLAVDWAARGVTVNAVAPGWIETGVQTPMEFEQGLRTPVGRSARPDEVASAIGWLASPGASYVTVRGGRRGELGCRGACLIPSSGRARVAPEWRHAGQWARVVVKRRVLAVPTSRRARRASRAWR